MSNPVPNLAQALVQKFIKQPTYMQGVTDAVTMIRSNVKLPRNTRYNKKSKRSIAHLAVEQLVIRRSVGSTEFWSSGHFSACFRHVDEGGQEYAIKISLRADDGAVPYYRWVWENKKWEDSEHFPVLHFFGKVCGYDVCVMEWLPDRSYLDALDYWAAMGDRCEVENYTSEHEHYTMSLLEAGEELRRLSKLLRLGFDIHGENMRLREDGTLVYSDPFGFMRKGH